MAGEHRKLHAYMQAFMRDRGNSEWGNAPPRHVAKASTRCVARLIVERLMLFRIYFTTSRASSDAIRLVIVPRFVDLAHICKLESRQGSDVRVDLRRLQSARFCKARLKGQEYLSPLQRSAGVFKFQSLPSLSSS